MRGSAQEGVAPAGVRCAAGVALGIRDGIAVIYGAEEHSSRGMRSSGGAG